MSSKEKIKSLETPSRPPRLRTSSLNPKQLAEFAHGHRKKIGRALKKIEEMERRFPDYFVKMKKDHASFYEAMAKAKTLGNITISTDNPKEMEDLIRQYSSLGKQLNHNLETNNREAEEDRAKRFCSFNHQNKQTFMCE